MPCNRFLFAAWILISVPGDNFKKVYTQIEPNILIVNSALLYPYYIYSTLDNSDDFSDVTSKI